MVKTKKKSKKVILAALLLILSIWCICVICLSSGKHAEKYDLYPTEKYTIRQVNTACRTIETFFYKHFKGCILLELRYNAEIEAKYSIDAAEYKEEGKDIIVILSTFQTNAIAEKINLVPNFTYSNWIWTLEKTPIGWKIIDCGCL